MDHIAAAAAVHAAAVAHAAVPPLLGAAARFTPAENEAILLAVAENRCEPSACNASGIAWTRINQLVMAGTYGEALRSRVATSDSKVLRKRWVRMAAPAEDEQAPGEDEQN